ncbi:hypothetical protein KC332_g13920 [Hortaea werneckii]|nr:hypothetical protein KC350_g16504 [Hortaea werneckii]KAI6806162.1 hypothetical protein KC358_g13970 [Hortaea werneckii]KAI6908177.1 hypothetical protein KC348_g13943 [Hortaea werneckii]KAI6919411.1 hypothetical protein KC341_g17317 [Hortaea werneckii]KAI6958747.1 hypothetical protein KC321_g13836 [Hortaea werneckii]
MLRQLQKHRSHGYFWIDAICINQDDIDEKNCQVQMMGEIYESAECVIACLGEHADDSRLLFEHLGDLDAAMGIRGVTQGKVDFARGRSVCVPTFTWLGTIGRVVAYDLCNALNALMRRSPNLPIPPLYLVPSPHKITHGTVKKPKGQATNSSSIPQPAAYKHQSDESTAATKANLSTLSPSTEKHETGTTSTHSANNSHQTSNPGV